MAFAASTRRLGIALACHRCLRNLGLVRQRTRPVVAAALVRTVAGIALCLA